MPPSYCKTAVLLQVFTTHRRRLFDSFERYDTEIVGGGKYQLPRGLLLVLILQSGDHLWTTIRRYTREKDAYYRSNVGQEFVIAIASHGVSQ